MWRWIILGLGLGALAVLGIFMLRSRHSAEPSQTVSHTWLKLA